MATRQVLVTFDNGTERVLPSAVLLSEDATFGDAVTRVNASHASSLWKVAAVELAGFVREKDFQSRQAMVLRAGETQRLSDVLSLDCFLVFRGAAFAATDGNIGVGNQGEAVGDDAEAQDSSGSDTLKVGDTVARHGEDQIQSVAGCKRVSREEELLAEQWGRRPKRAKRVSIAPRPYSPQIGVADKDWQSDTVHGLPNKQRNQRTSRHNLPASLIPGTLKQQRARRVYFAEDNETPVDIARKFGVSVDKIVYDNCVGLPSLRKNSRLMPLTPIVLPLIEDVA
jgi:hypothetical protein